MPSNNHRHRSGPLHQSNKRNKRTTTSKRSQNRIAGAGKVNSVTTRKNVKSNKGLGGKSKAERLLRSKQRRDASRKLVIDSKRRGGGVGGTTTRGGAGVPRIVGIISLSSNETTLEHKISNYLQSGADSIHDENGGCVTLKFNSHKKHQNGMLTILKNTTSFRGLYDKEEEEEDKSVMGALDLCRVCDLIIFALDANDADVNGIVSAEVGDGPGGMSVGGTTHTSSTTTSNNKMNMEELISERGDRILTAIKGQGLPTPLTLLVHSETSPDDDDDGSSLMSMGSSIKSAKRHAMKRRLELKRYVHRLAMEEFGDDAKMMEIDLPLEDDVEDGMKDDGTEQQSKATSQASVSLRSKKILPISIPTHPSATLVRTLCTMAASPPRWVNDVPRSYLVAEMHSYQSTGEEGEGGGGELLLTGYIRGTVPFNVNSLVHVPNLGTFGCRCVTKVDAPLSSSRTLNKTMMKNDEEMKTEEDDNAAVVVLHADPSKRESLDMFATPHALDGEQNLIGFDDDNDNFDDDDDDIPEDDGEFKKGSSRPAGWSDYQSAWLDAVDPDSAPDDDKNNVDHGELAFELNKKSSTSDAVSVMNMDDDDDDVNDAERKVLQTQRLKDAQTNLEFPDEIELPETILARDRLARYRSLKSFRTSTWDPKENLPYSYGKIYHLDSYKCTRRDVLGEMEELKEASLDADREGKAWGFDSNATAGGNEKDDEEDKMMDDDSSDNDEDNLLDGCIPTGTYVTLTLTNVSQTSYQNLISPSTTNSVPILTAVTLLPHEHKVSILHTGLTSKFTSQSPIKSKDILTFRCGWRTWKAKPIFSQINLNSDKHKFERYMPDGGTSGAAYFAGSLFGPVTYGPCPVLVFRDQVEPDNKNNDEDKEEDGMRKKKKSKELVAMGSILNADADRIVIKRIVLTGYPTRVHKRHATVKYMFFNPEDVKWFKPATLTTKHGLQGNIIESVGDHGTMKCLFNAPIKQHDTVCLPLYKRIYPKFAPVNDDDNDGNGGGVSMKKDLVVL